MRQNKHSISILPGHKRMNLQNPVICECGDKFWGKTFAHAASLHRDHKIELKNKQDA